MKDKRLQRLPIIAIEGVVIFPSTVTNFPLDADKWGDTLKLVSDKYENKVIITGTRADGDVSIENIYKMGVFAEVKQVLTLPGNKTHLIVEGISRAEIAGLDNEEGVFYAEAEEIIQDTDTVYEDVMIAFFRVIGEKFNEFYRINHGKGNGQELIEEALNDANPGKLSDIICAALPMSASEKQELLEMKDPDERIKHIYVIVHKELNILKMKKEIESKVKVKMDKAQRDYYLKEKLKIIHEELGDQDEVQEEVEKYTKLLKKKNPPDNVKSVIEKEIKRLNRIPLTTPEASVTRNYIEYILSIPWSEKTEDNRDIIKAEKILEEDHYGLKEVKERIVEYLAVRMNTEETNSTILCLVGPPGVGKTSVAKSIARALGRKYVRMSLGGVRDEAEIRGHRKTYVSAMPGRIISSMKQAGTINPLMLLDEVDKLNSSIQGDPAAALLEVLDSEQNNAFRDNYIELEYDLSKVLFICTANDASTIPDALRDRMELIELSGYTAEEKKQIALRHLIPKQLKENGLKKKQLNINEKAVENIIQSYCREAGVRKLERIIGKLCRMSVKKILAGEKKSVRITAKNLEEYLGIPKYKPDPEVYEPLVGVVRGLAWTQVGGETLLVEVNTMKGSGKLELTGNMGDIMQESAKVALAYIRSSANSLGISPDFYKKTDINLHIPQGAVPKDGPSAGITMTIAMISALTGKPVRNDIAMTGEVTIRGRVLAIGGLNEKVLAAKRIGISNIILPEANGGDIQEMPEEIKSEMNFIYVKEMQQVIDNAFAGGAII